MATDRVVRSFPSFEAGVAGIQHPCRIPQDDEGRNEVRDSRGLDFAATGMRLAVLLCAALISPVCWSGELLVYTFFQERPFSGLVIEVDGERLGKTDQQGAVRSELTAGQHRLRCLKDGAELARQDFIVAAGESAEVSITFADFQGAAKVAVATFDDGTPDTALMGTVRGVVADQQGRAAIAATIRAGAGTGSMVTRSDAAGKFNLQLPRGSYRLEVVHPDYESVTSEAIRVVANVGIATSITLRSGVPAAADEAPQYTAADFADVEEVEVVGTFNPTEDAADLEKFSVAITDSISIEDLLRFGDSDVASALKRIVGVAVTGGKYANVRGLDGRYISSTLNGGLMPSTDPFRRDVQLDLFPSEILAGIEIQKSFTSDLPGDTTGGIIKMTTRGLPDEDEAGVSISLGYVNGVTGEDRLSYAGGDTDGFGVDDGSRELPGYIRSRLENGNFRFSICQSVFSTNCISRDESVEMARRLPVIYAPTRETATPNMGLAMKFGKSLERQNGEWGAYGSVTYDQGYSSRQEATVDDFSVVGSYDRDVFATSLNSYFVTGYRANAGWSVTSKTMLLRDAEDRTTVESFLQKGEEADSTEDRVVLEWIERQFIGQFFDASLALFGSHTLEVRAGLTQTSRYSPDRREYLYLGGNFSVSDFQRNYADLTENGVDLGLDYTWPVAINDWLFTNLRFGITSNTRERDNEQIRLGVLRRGFGLDLRQSPEELLAVENFNYENDGYWELRSTGTTTTDTYAATQDSLAAYISSETDIGANLSLTAGVRLDQYDIELEYPNEPTAGTTRSSDDILPGLLATYRIGEDIQIRGGYSRTVSRPNITELANSRFYDQEGRQYIGCPACEDTVIDNIDLRGEYYFGLKDSISVALFYKMLDQPLERAVVDGSGSASRALTFRNAESATLQGIEVDGSKLLWDGIDNVVTLSGNLAFIQSDVELDADGQRLELNPNRELQGQAPFLGNLQFAVDNYEWDIKLTLVANYFDDRIYVVTRRPQPTIYEVGRLDFSLNAEKKFVGGSKVSLKIKNLLDEPTEYRQENQIIESYKRGTSLSLGYSYAF